MNNINIAKKKIDILCKKLKIYCKQYEYKNKKNKLKEINKKLEDLNIWKNKKKAQSLNKERFNLIKFLEEIDIIKKLLEESIIFLDLINESKNNKYFQEIFEKLKIIKKKISKIELKKKFIGKYDVYNCYIDIQAGSGGIDAQDWANMIMRMYIRWSETKYFKVDIIEKSIGEIAGIKSATLYIKGKNVYGLLKNENGIHRLVRKSPFNAHNRRHTSFSSAFIYPDIADSKKIIINPLDLRIDVYRSSGAGGQHVNCTESAVRITHIPTKTVVQCQSNRSQHKNKEQAMKQMKSKLHKLNIQKKHVEKKKIEKNKKNITWGRQIRSYYLDNSIVKDIRTGIEKKNIHDILNGNLDVFIEANLNKITYNKN